MEISSETKKYWTDADWTDAANAESVSSLYVIAQRIIDRMPQGSIGQVCGPIATGGKGSIQANLEHFNTVIGDLQQKGHIVFDQMPFEPAMQSLKTKLAQGGYMESILTDFYLPLIESGKISTFYFMPDWQSSKGATWEHGEAKRFGIEIVYL